MDPTLSMAAVSPPTRGWTRGHRLWITSFALLRWFPRPRGDGPDMTLRDIELDLVSPPTRGWTLDDVSLSLVGFPAHAGMADAPASMKVSPPTRGWTETWRAWY